MIWNNGIRAGGMSCERRRGGWGNFKGGQEAEGKQKMFEVNGGQVKFEEWYD